MSIAKPQGLASASNGAPGPPGLTFHETGGGLRTRFPCVAAPTAFQAAPDACPVNPPWRMAEVSIPKPFGSIRFQGDAGHSTG